MSDDDKDNGKPGGTNESEVEAIRRTFRHNGTFAGNPRAGRKCQFQLVNFDDLKVSTAANYLIQDVLPQTGVALVWGKPKCGKSFWAFDLALHVDRGWDWHGRKVLRGPVVYMAFEGGAGYPARAEAFRRTHIEKRRFALNDLVRIKGSQQTTMIYDICEHNGEPGYLVAGHADPLPASMLRLTPSKLHLITSNSKLVKDHKELILSIDAQIEMPPMMVVLDTLNRGIDGSESNDEDVRAYLDAAETIVNVFGCLVLIVHHCGIDGSRPRGHSSLTGTVVAQIKIERDAAKRIVAELEFARDFEEGAVFLSKLLPVTVGVNDMGMPIISCAVVPVASTTPTTAARTQPLRGQARLAFDTLVAVLARCGTAAPAGTRMAGSRVVAMKPWRQEFYGRHTGENERSKKTAFKRAADDLAELGMIDVWQDQAWITPKGEVAATQQPAAQAAAQAAWAADVFDQLLRRFTREQRTVSGDTTAADYAPAVFAGEPEAAGITLEELAAAMQRLLAEGLARIERAPDTAGGECERLMPVEPQPGAKPKPADRE